MDTAWALWGGAVLVSFGVLEGVALRAGRLDWTLSAALRRLLRIPPGKWWAPGALAFLAGLAVLWSHIAAGVP